MIHYLKKHQIDIEKYDDCIAKSLQFNIYAFSWYLDLVTDHWDVLVLNDYEAVMPLPIRKKWGFTYVYQPFWILELGIFSTNETINYQLFINEISRRFRFAEVRLNTENKIFKSKFLTTKFVQELEISNLQEVQNSYRKDRKKDLLKATNACLELREPKSAVLLIDLFKNNIGNRIQKITTKDYQNLLQLTEFCMQKKVGEVLEVYEDEQLVAAGFFLKHQKKVSILFSATDISKRANGANTFLIDEAIKRYTSNDAIFNFGGSSIPTIAAYFLSFGAETKEYKLLKINRLPIFLKK